MKYPTTTRPLLYPTSLVGLRSSAVQVGGAVAGNRKAPPKNVARKRPRAAAGRLQQEQIPVQAHAQQQVLASAEQTTPVQIPEEDSSSRRTVAALVDVTQHDGQSQAFEKPVSAQNAGASMLRMDHEPSGAASDVLHVSEGEQLSSPSDTGRTWDTPAKQISAGEASTGEVSTVEPPTKQVSTGKVSTVEPPTKQVSFSTKQVSTGELFTGELWAGEVSAKQGISTKQEVSAKQVSSAGSKYPTTGLRGTAPKR